MDSTLSISSSSMTILPASSPPKRHIRRISQFGLKRRRPFNTVYAISNNSASSSTSEDVHRRRSSLESLFCYDKPIPEEKIEKPIGLSLAGKIIGDNPRCPDCQSKGVVLCSTCSGSGLYVDSILESQGIIVKVRCLGCGGAGNTMCPECGGRGHLGVK